MASLAETFLIHEFVQDFKNLHLNDSSPKGNGLSQLVVHIANKKLYYLFSSYLFLDANATLCYFIRHRK